MAELKDSGSKREFSTGAHRDESQGKGRCDLIPLDVVYTLFKSDKSNWVAGDTLKWLHEFMESKDEESLILALGCFTQEADMQKETAILEVAKQYEDGANKYGENNWKKGMPLHVFIDSATRHYLKWHRGDADEMHHRGFIWNMLGAVWTIRHVADV